MTIDTATTTATPSLRSLVPIEWVQTHNPQDVLLLARLLRQTSPSVRRAINARLPQVETTEEISALMAVTRCLNRIHQRAARRQVLEMIADPFIPLEKVELAAALHYTQQENDQLRQVQAEPPRAAAVSFSLGDEMTGLNWFERLSRRPRVRKVRSRLGRLVALILQGAGFLFGWLGGLVVGGAFCGGLALLAFGLLQPLYVNDWQTFILDNRVTHYFGWLALLLSGGLLPMAFVLLPLRWALGLYHPVRRYVAARRQVRVLQQIRWDDSNPATLLLRAQDQIRMQRWHSAPCARVARTLFMGLAVLGGLIGVACGAAIVSKPCAGLLLAKEWFWPIIVAITVLGYLICALYQLYDAGMQKIDSLV
jgi:hypothetical protein